MTSLGDDKVSVVTEVKLWDKGKALDQLSRHLNLYRADQEAGAPRVVTRNDKRDEALLAAFGGKDDGTDE